MKKNTKMPLSGIKVLEFGQIAAGPFAGSLLADLGADVVKVENPDGGDGMRLWPPLSKGENKTEFSENFASLNRNKRSVAIDLKKSSDIKILKELISVCDVLIENYRPGVMDKLNLGYDTLKKINSSLIYCSISGYGQIGPNAKKGAFDVTVQAFSGLMSVTGNEDSEPVKCGVPFGDFCAGLYASYSILAKIIHKNSIGGRGGFIDCSMLGSLIGVSALQTSEYFGTGLSPKAMGSAHPRNAPYRAFKAKDNHFIIAAGNDKLWLEVVDVVKLSKLKYDKRFKTQQLRAKHQEKLFELLQPEFEKKEAKYWIFEMDRRGVPCSLINKFSDVIKENQVKEMELVLPLELPNGKQTKTTAFPIKISDYKFNIYRPPPNLGNDNNEIISDWLKKD